MAVVRGDGVNFCRSCAKLHGSAKSAPPSAWLCTDAVRTEIDRVTGETPPFYACWRIRRLQPSDECSNFVEGPNCLNLRESENAR